MRKRIVGILTIAALAAGLLSGCGALALAESFDADKVIDTAEQVVTYANDEDYASITAMVTSDYQDELSEEVLGNALGTALEDKGALVDYKSETVVGASDKNYDGDLAVAVLVAEYEEGTATYTLEFNTDYEIMALYIK